MKKCLLVLAFAGLSLTAMADDVPGMVISKNDGSNLKIALSQIRSIKFDGSFMLISKTDNTQQSVALNDVSVITFGDVQTAIRTIVGTENRHITITDLSGRTIYKGESQGDKVPTSLHGTYIISVNGQSHKVCLP